MHSLTRPAPAPTATSASASASASAGAAGVRPGAVSSGTSDAALIDSLGRPLHDLRISVTDRCNFRCTYCMPK
jgi:sulfatase maturation enzyme AslB (radical SAM superfamily)